LSLNSSTGVLSGTPASAGTYNFVVQVTDSVGGTATQNLSILIAALLNSGGGSWQNPFVVAQQRQPAVLKPWYRPNPKKS
jgi:hypothetical protein